MKTLNELSAPRDIQRKSLERDIQKRCVDWMRSRGYWARKFSSMSQRSVPDYLFAKIHAPCKLFFACEFKAPGKEPTTQQLEEMTFMAYAGIVTFWCDDFEDFKKIILELEANPK